MASRTRSNRTADASNQPDAVAVTPLDHMRRSNWIGKQKTTLVRQELFTCSVAPNLARSRLEIWTCSECDSYQQARYYDEKLPKGVDDECLPQEKWPFKFRCSGGGRENGMPAPNERVRALTSYSNNGQSSNADVDDVDTDVNKNPIDSMPANAVDDMDRKPAAKRRRLQTPRSTSQNRKISATVTPVAASASPDKAGCKRLHAISTQKVAQLNSEIADLKKDTVEKNKRIVDLESMAESSQHIGVPAPDNPKASYLRLLGTMEAAVATEKPTNPSSARPRKVPVREVGAAVESLTDHLLDGRWKSTKARALAEAVFKQETCKEDIEVHLTKFSHKQMRKVFVPWKLQETMDMGSAGSLNYTAIDNLRSIENLGKKERGALPSLSTVASRAKMLNECAETGNHCPFEAVQTDHGPLYKFNLELTLRATLKAYGLLEHATIPDGKVQLSTTLDGAKLTKFLSHVAAGIKTVDGRAIDPLTGHPLFLTTRHQSCDVCFPLASFFGKDNKRTHNDVFKPHFFDFFNKVKIEGLPESEHGPKMHPLDTTSPQDMSSLWKFLCRGGGSSNTTLFCHCCICSRENKVSHKSCSDRCERCVNRNRQKCFHHDVTDKRHIQECVDKVRDTLQDQVSQLAVHFPRHKEIQQNSRMCVDVNERNKEKNLMHVDHQVPEDDLQKRARCNGILMSELMMRKPDNHVEHQNMSLEERRACLRHKTESEKKVLLLEKILQREEKSSEAALILIEQAIPCILHLENRVGEKILHTLLSTGMARYGDGSSTKKSLFVERCTACVQERVLSDEGSDPLSWKFPLSNKKNTIGVGAVSMPNARTRQIVTSLHALIDVVFGEELDQADDGGVREENERLRCEWRSLIDCYIPMMEKARQQEDFEEEEIESFQDMCDDFFESWVRMHGNDNVTNYIHVIGAGHLRYCLQIYRNLC